MGSIFEAVDGGLGHRVALKRLHPHVAARPGATERFLREGRAAARIRHPHVVQVFALGEESAGPYLAMELLDGCDLSATLVRAGKLALEDALELLLPVIAAVAAAHDAGVIHRDLKPSNIFISQGPAGRRWPKVLDFGVSKVLGADGAGASTAGDAVVGTAAYMAPEQARSVREASFQSDQYALAIVLYQCLIGRVPFSGASEYELVLAIMTAPVAAPSEEVASLPALLDPIVLRALHRHPNERFASLRSFGAALLPFARERDRLAWGAELSDESTPPPKASNAGSSADAELTTGELTSPATMPPTSRSAHPSPRATRIAGRRWVRLAVAGAVALGAAGAWIGWGPRRPLPLESQPASADSRQGDRASPKGTGSEARRDSSEVHASEPTTLTVVGDVSAAPWSSRPPVVPTRPRRPAPSASTSTASPASRRAPTLGDNGAPILP
jgi:eukaryotic-like serine/threonine-protein kinase